MSYVSFPGRLDNCFFKCSLYVVAACFQFSGSAGDTDVTFDTDNDDDVTSAASFVDLRAGQFCIKTLCEHEGVSTCILSRVRCNQFACCFCVARSGRDRTNGDTSC